MNVAITAILALIQQILPLVGAGGNVALVNSIITALEQWMPLIITEGGVLITTVKNIIATLSTSAVTPDQVASLQALDAKCDAAFEAATVGLDPDVAS